MADSKYKTEYKVVTREWDDDITYVINYLTDLGWKKEGNLVVTDHKGVLHYTQVFCRVVEAE